jgi:hypothetical protein
MQRLKVSCAVRRLYGSLGIKGLITFFCRRDKNKPNSKLCSRDVRFGYIVLQNFYNLPVGSEIEDVVKSLKYRLQCSSQTSKYIHS